MNFLELCLIGVGLSMDAFAVSVCKGLKMPRINKGQLFLIALFFGGFQALMPLIGYFLGRQFEQYIVSFDHWVAFALLAFIGGKMIFEALKGEECEDCKDERFSLRELIMMAVATSIDALAVGITFAFLQVNIWTSIFLIGVITFFLSAVGVFIGHRFGARYQSKAELLGGVILVLIGCKILLEHLELLPF